MIEGIIIIVTTLLVVVIIHHIWKWTLQRTDIPGPHVNHGRKDELIQGKDTTDTQYEKSYMVEIHRELYVVSQPPPIESLVVKREMQSLASGFDIEEVIRQIDIVAMCLKMVFYGVVGKRDLELKVVEMQGKVEELCNVSGKAVKQFGIKAGGILSQMQHGIESLMEGYSEEASEHFKKIGEASTDMKKTATNMKEALNELEMAVSKVFLDVTETTTAHIEATKKKRRQLIKTDVTDGRKALLKRKMRQAKADREQAEKRYESMPAGDIKSRIKAHLDSDQAKRNSAICFCGPGVCCIVCCDRDRLLCTHNKRRFFFYDQNILEAGHYKLLDREMADRIEALKERERLRRVEEAATEELLEYIESLKRADPIKDTDHEDLIETALRGAEKALKTLRSAISRIVEFWDDLNVQSESIIDAGSGCIGKMGREMDAKKRDEFFKSRTFQTGAVEYLAKWVAMQMMCKAFTKSLKPVRRALQCSISDTPNKQQASTKIPELVLELDTKLRARRDTLHAEDEEDAHEMRAIREG